MQHFAFGNNEKAYDCSFIPMSSLRRSLNPKGQRLDY